MSGTTLQWINHYRSWPKYRTGYDFSFDDCEQWNQKWRIIVPEDEPDFDRTDYDQMDKEIQDEVITCVCLLIRWKGTILRMMPWFWFELRKMYCALEKYWFN